MRRNLNNKNISLLLCSLTLLLLSPAKTVFAQTASASVLEISGGWYVVGRGNISRGSALHSGARVRASSPQSSSDYIIITNLRGEIIARRYCRNEGSCNIPIAIPAPPVCGVLCRLYGSVMTTLGSDPARFRNTGSQGLEKGLQEGVVSLNKKKIDLRPVFREMPDGKYRIRFVDPPCQDLSDCKTLFAPVDFYWSSKKPSLLSVGNLQPGLYEVQFLRDDEDEPTGEGEAWILIADSRKFQALSANFARSVRVTKKWTADSQIANGGAEDKVRNSTVSSFLRAALFNLSKEPQTKTARKRKRARA